MVWVAATYPLPAGTVFVVGFLVLGIFQGFPGWWQAAPTEASASVTLSMVFVIQHTTNRQAPVTVLKLDELICVTEGSGGHVIGIENRELHDREDLGEHNDLTNAASFPRQRARAPGWWGSCPRRW